jgi:hypothetical protein
MTDAEVLDALDDRTTLALTAWAEARRIPRNDPRDHSPVEELIAVMWVVRNRRPRFVRWQATDASYKALCLAPKQFSCWNPGSGSNHDALMALATVLTTGDAVTRATARTADPLVRECLFLADGVIAGTLIDRTGGATSYWAPLAMNPPGRTPSWAAGLLPLAIGDQYFVHAV